MCLSTQTKQSSLAEDTVFQVVTRWAVADEDIGKVKLEEEEKRDAASSEDEAVEDDEDETTQIVIDHETPPAGVPQPKNLGDRS
jgi:hypothetical protein